MGDRKGWVRFSRSWLAHPIIHKDTDHLLLWLYLVCNAAFEPTQSFFSGKPIILKPGQITTGRKQLSVMTGVQEKKVYRILKEFESGHLIGQQTSSQNTLISIISENFDCVSGQQDEQQMGNKWATDGQQVGTLEEYNNRELRIECMAGKPPRKKFVHPSVDDVRKYCDERKNEVDPQRFVDYYETNGWVQGHGKPIKDWKAAVRTWEHNSSGEKGVTQRDEFSDVV